MGGKAGFLPLATARGRLRSRGGSEVGKDWDKSDRWKPLVLRFSRRGRSQTGHFLTDHGSPLAPSFHGVFASIGGHRFSFIG